MVKRVFLGQKELPASAIARALAEFRDADNLSDLGRILLVLPGQLARKNVMQQLPEYFPGGLLVPQLLTPRLLLNFGRPELPAISPVAEEILWGKVLKYAAGRKERFSEVFPGGRVPEDFFAASKTLRTFRDELTANGFSIADAAKEMGARGAQLAELEKLYLRELAAGSYTDKLADDLRSVGDNGAFAEVDRIILAGLPDLPRILKLKLADIDRLYPGKIEIWITDDEKNRADYDCWGIPVPEVWQDKYLPLELKNIHLALDPADAAHQAMFLSGDPENFSPENCTVVLSDPALYGDFSREFSRLTTISGKKVTVADQSGVPLGKLRISRLLSALLEVLEHRDDYDRISAFFREADFLASVAENSAEAGGLTTLLDDFQQKYYPDSFASARQKFTGKYYPLAKLARALDKCLQMFDVMEPAGFLRQYLTGIFFKTPGSEEVFNVPFDRECTIFNEQLSVLESISPEMAAIPGKSGLLKIFLRSCRDLPVNSNIPDGAMTFEGRLEMPFLTTKRVIFCGMNEEYFPDKIDITPYLNDTLRRKLGMRSNQETLARSLCHLFNVAMPRQNGDLQIIVLKFDSKKAALSPSRLLFSGNTLPQEELLARCDKLFADPETPPEVETVQANREFRIQPDLHYRTTEDGKLRFAVTDFDQYLRNPFSYFWERVLNSSPVDYEIMEPDPRSEGDFCHQAFEMLGCEHFPTEDKLREKLFFCFDTVLKEYFGTLPAMVRIYSDNMKQRLNHAAEILFREQTGGFEVIAVEYPLGGENNFLEYSGVLFRGKIDRIECSISEKIIRIIDIKTGSVDNVITEHCKKNKTTGMITFSRLQLPLYALLLANDPWFREHYCPDIGEYTIECAYLTLPRSVTDTALAVWKYDDPKEDLSLINVLPAAEEEVKRIIREIKLAAEGKVFCSPESVKEPLFQPGAREATTGIEWIYDEDMPDFARQEPPATVPDEERSFLPVYNTRSSKTAGNTRCCTCPVKNCPCRNGDCSSCASFNGFKAFNIITASAGTGKTFALASRFIQLLDYGVKPENILAVTFTRKATGEILDRIVRRLCGMISKPDRPENHCIRISMSRRTELLRQLLACGSKAPQISTIDSFFMNLFKVFAPELGIWGDISMIDENDLRPVKETMRAWIRSISGGTELDTLREMIKDANASEQKSFFASMQKLVKDVYPCYLLKLHKNPDGTFPQLEYIPWYPETSDVMTPEKCISVENILQDQTDAWQEQLEQKINTISTTSLPALIRRVRSLQSELAKSRHGALFGRLSRDTTQLFKQINDNNPAGWCDQDDEAELFYLVSKDKNPEKARKKHIIFSGNFAGSLRLSMRHIRTLAYLQSRSKNRAVFALMDKFDRIYTELIRNSGKLTFDDPPALLCKPDPESGENILGPGDHSLEMRLDTTISHYMFDEFQDTSDIQLTTLLPLLRELFAKGGNDGFRSFFCVGDIKQSIYQWRGGNPELFNYLAAQLLNTVGGQYDPCDSLSCSYRSSQVVLDVVNAVFDGNYCGDQLGFAEALKKMKFLPHTSAAELDGHAAVIEVPKDNSSYKYHNTGKARIIARILEEIQPFKRGLTVGILVRANSAAENICDALRTMTDLPVSLEGKISPAQSMAFSVFRELLTLAEHPGDKQAANFLDSLTFASGREFPVPCGREKIAVKLGFPADVPLDESVRGELFRNGLYAMARRFVDAYAPEVTAKERRFMEIMLRMADGFTGKPADFIANMEKSGESGNALKSTIQIMTIHKSKGMEFDIVFLPDLENHRSSRSALAPEFEHTAPDEIGYAADLPVPRWATYMPPSAISCNIPPFREYEEKQAVDDAFEKICNLYVAMTRAKHALYMLLSCGKSSTSLAPDMLVKERLGAYRSYQDDFEWAENFCTENFPAVLHFSHGDRRWFGKYFPLHKEESSPRCRLPQFIPADIPVISTASGAETHRFTGNPAQRFALLPGKVSGTLIHELFAQLEFIDEHFDAAQFSRDLPAGAAEIFCNAMQPGSPVRELFRRPAGNCEVWRERRFLLKTPAGELVPGAFDRVMIFRENGSVSRAVITDFKSDDLKQPEAFAVYFPQLTSYRRSLAILLDLPESQISCQICALRLNQIIPVE